MDEEAARAKVNLYLRVLGRRADGYHLLDSLVVFAGVGDVVRAEAAEGLSLTVEGPFAAGLAGEGDNLVLQAARALARAGGVAGGAALTLVKNLPVASGIGGGSADAAAALRLLQRLWGLAMPPVGLAGIAAELGADVPACLLSSPVRMQGVGELLGTAPVLPSCGMVLVNPGVAVSTAAVFAARREEFGEAVMLPALWGTGAEMAADLAAAGNDLEAAAMGICVEVGAALGWLREQPGCLLAQMSGSGATCFGLFTEGAEAEAVAAGVPVGWWGWGGEMSR